MINKKKLTKQIWYENELWDVVEVFSPTEYDDYILVKQTIKDGYYYEAPSIHPVEMRLIDAGNDRFYPNTKKIREAMGKVINIEQQEAKVWEEVDEVLLDTWLEVCGPK